VNAGGDNIAPQRIEGFLTLQPEISQAMVYGDKKPNLSALIVPDPNFVADWAKENGQTKDTDALVDDEEFRKVISAALDRVNEDLSVVEKVRRFVVTGEAFTIENEMMTPSLKIRRHIIKVRYGDALEALYVR
jgi:long-chain acyl-CoA synthetase